MRSDASTGGYMREKAVYDKIIRRKRLEPTPQSAVSFPCPLVTPCLIPVIHASTPLCINVPFMAAGETYLVTSFSLLGPFGAVLVENIDNLDISLHGPLLSTHTLFPLGADIVFIEIVCKDMIKIRLYEKEKGPVKYSQRGACAAFVAAVILGKSYGSAFVEMGSKICRVEWDGVDGDVRLIEGISS